jgi:UDP-GlcNAc:undecaprenyl-phosphate GlcNAc-1-phosphate transferase
MDPTIAQVTPGHQGGLLEGFRTPLLAAFIALTVSWMLTPWVRKLAIQRGAVDDPTADDRRVHREPTPRWGGLAIYAGVFVALAIVLPFAFPRPFPPYVIGMTVIGAAIVVMGALDDVYQFRAAIQAGFLLVCGLAIQAFTDGASRQVQIPGIGMSPLGREWFDFGIAAVPITAIYIFVVTKTMDTIDGIDGLASGIAAIAACTLSVIGTYEGQPRVAIIAAAVGGAALGFLRHNYNPARIFLGTGGAQLLGFLLACLSIVGAMKTAAAVAILVPLLAFGVPIVDAVQVVLRRIRGRRPISQADTQHLHHQLLRRGLSQRQAVWILYVVAAVLCGMLFVVVRLYG